MLEPAVNTSTIGMDVASREAAEREMALNAALAGPAATTSLELPVLRQPILPGNFQKRFDKLDKGIQARGVAVSRERLLSLGKSRFTELQAVDHHAREVQRVIYTGTDLTSWESVFYSFAKAGAITTPKQSTAEALAGAGEDRLAVAKVASFDDLWKTTEPESVRNIFAFRDAYNSLIFGQSLLERLADDGRVRISGSKTTAKLFADWLGVLEGPHLIFLLRDPLWHAVAWLVNDQSQPPNDLAQSFLGVRAPSRDQLKLCDAVWRGFLRGHSGWSLWDYVGRASRHATGVETLETWRRHLARLHPRIQLLHDSLKTAFHRQIGGPDYARMMQFDPEAHRSFIDRSIQAISNQLAGMITLSMEGMFEGACVCRSGNWFLCEAKTEKIKSISFLDPFISERLEAAFKGQRFFHSAFAIQKLP